MCTYWLAAAACAVMALAVAPRDTVRFAPCFAEGPLNGEAPSVSHSQGRGWITGGHGAVISTS